MFRPGIDKRQQYLQPTERNQGCQQVDDAGLRQSLQQHLPAGSTEGFTHSELFSPFQETRHHQVQRIDPACQQQGNRHHRKDIHGGTAAFRLLLIRLLRSQVNIFQWD